MKLSLNDDASWPYLVLRGLHKVATFRHECLILYKLISAAWKWPASANMIPMRSVAKNRKGKN
jgi:hypothetical protein